jgi:hypothetical protein
MRSWAEGDLDAESRGERVSQPPSTLLVGAAFVYDRRPMAAVSITRFQRLPQPPMNAHGDQIWWEAQLESGSASFTVHLWIPRSEERSIQGNPDDWARAELEKLAQKHSPLGRLYAFSPIALGTGGSSSVPEPVTARRL